ncbi:hypothetical protein AB0J14_04820 [Micromonospora arborensis]|uniref:hypothetical protein n=1 Tax=Micromonospora arborensis TaxID=2116518 RepID=UPI003407F469
MSRIDTPTDPAFVKQIARQVISSHERGDRCQRCTESGCDQLDWAQMMLRDLAAATGERRAAIADGRPADPTAGEVRGATA